MKEELDTLLIGVVVAFMFGWFGPVRPGALISLCHPGYQVPSFARLIVVLLLSRGGPAHQNAAAGPLCTSRLHPSSSLPTEPVLL